jgi:hypothetical protein
MGGESADNGSMRRSRRIWEYNIQLDVRGSNIGRPQLRRRDQHTLQEDGTDQTWPNP